MPLSDVAVRKAKPTGKVQRLFDGFGLYLEISPTGAKLWRQKYRFGGKEKRLAHGTYPEVTLAQARERLAAARKLLAAGVDPADHKRAEKAAGDDRAANSFEVIAREWLSKRDWVPAYTSKVTAWLENDVFPWIGKRPVTDLAAPEFLSVARRIESRGAIESAHRVMQNCGQVMRYAIATGRARYNPVVDLKGALAPAPEKHHAAITDATDIGPLLRAIDAYKGNLVTRIALQLAPLVFVRPGELRNAEWAEIDLEAAEWNIPAAKMKMRQPHLVPLSRQAVALLEELQPLTSRSQYVFPGGRSIKRPMSDNALNAALRRMGFDKDTMTAHGFRAMARTVLDEVLHFRPDYIEHQLAHAVRDPNGRAYNRTAHLPERRKMMQAWADYLDLQKADTGTVLPFRKKSGTSR
ncbi:tyrosine-type recombinase/integrase [Aerolutibacter ruishenii]|uniref:Integrase n=1 Tax=Aerolutibacter ruishenii TaxID=686800 RepID=A0A562LYJ7_9GAMM|nr:integrase arm-type DNA-binding domain-containing protein [Lysobacter ruishenii]TWI12719.1 integrase [Lysobacter ruishenii]